MSFARQIAPAFVLAAGLAATPALAADTYALDPSHVALSFTVDHLGFSDVRGQFDEMEGTLTLDEADPTNSSVTITIQADSIDTGWDARDQHIRQPDFLNVAEYPTIVFESTSVEMTGDETATVTGDLTMLGQTHPVTLDVVLNGLGENPLSGTPTVGFSATTEVDRTRFGNETFAPAIGTVLPVELSMEFTRAE